MELSCCSTYGGKTSSAYELHVWIKLARTNKKYAVRKKFTAMFFGQVFAP